MSRDRAVGQSHSASRNYVTRWLRYDVTVCTGVPRWRQHIGGLQRCVGVERDDLGGIIWPSHVQLDVFCCHVALSTATCIFNYPHHTYVICNASRLILELGRYCRCRYRYSPIFLTLIYRRYRYRYIYCSTLWATHISRSSEFAQRFCCRLRRPDGVVSISFDVQTVTLSVLVMGNSAIFTSRTT